MDRRRPIGSRALVLAAALCVLAPPLWTTRSPANPIPDGAVLVHVQEPDPTFCFTSPITTCDEIVQTTEADGQLQFDLFVYCIWAEPGTQIQSLLTTVEWPPSWNLVSYVACGLPLGGIDIMGHQAHIDLTWWDCPPMQGEVFHAASFVVDVQGYGTFGNAGGPADVYLGCPPDGLMLTLMGTAAHAGVECGYCFTPCDMQSPCRPVPDPDVLALEIRQGESSQAQVHVPIHGGPIGWPCTPSFTSTVPWMQASYEEIGWNDYMVTLDVDTSALAQGSHEGWLRVVDTCPGCTRVLLEVLPPVSSVPEDPGRNSTWGQIKGLYR